ncbi:MAG: ABC transporter ATP-binding protein, partial [Solirubrobacteraceae bacterium]
RLHRAQLAHAGRSGVERAGVDVLVTVGMLAVLIAAAGLATAGTIAVELFPPAVVLAAFTFHPITTLVDSARDLNLVAAAAERVAAILEEPTRVADRVSAPPAGPIEPRVRFGGVSFRYGDGLPDALHDASFEIAPGETVALVGHSGAGKSTAAHLLLRFWDVAAGTISVGGHDLRELPQATLRELVTFVPQDTYLFHSSVADNIRLGRPEATDEQVRRAARQALADEFIERLPDGYETIVGERGSKLSGGQRQRIALARAVLKDSPILVMDEPVSNLDAESELELRSAMAEARRGRTVLVIAHRLSTIKTADRLVVLERGRVAQVGRHDELLTAGGTYASLIAGQQIEAA